MTRTRFVHVQYDAIFPPNYFAESADSEPVDLEADCITSKAPGEFIFKERSVNGS